MLYIWQYMKFNTDKLIILFFINVLGPVKVLWAQPQIVKIDTNKIVNQTGTAIRLINWRGLSVVSNKVIWSSGSKGMVAISTDGGVTFTTIPVNQCRTCDFRDIEAFNEKEALVISSGFPAVVYKTNNGGNSWEEVFRKNDSAYFLNAIDFWDSKRGLILADPIDGVFAILETTNGGLTWKELERAKMPKAEIGEACFAASGTALRCWGKNSFAFVSGGGASRLFLFEKGIEKHQIFHVPAVSGKFSQGAYSLTVPFGNLIAVSGGDYTDDSGEQPALFVFNYKKPAWLKSKQIEPLTGYKSCIATIGSNKLLTCGTAGVDLIVQEKGYFKNHQITDNGYHTIGVAKKGNAVFLAGSNGKIARYKP